MPYWCDGSGRLNLVLTLDEARSGSHSGDCEADVRALAALPHIASQLAAWDMDAVRSNLLEYGMWDEEDLADDDMSVMRTLWLACGDIVDGSEQDDD